MVFTNMIHSNMSSQPISSLQIEDGKKSEMFFTDVIRTSRDDSRYSFVLDNEEQTYLTRPMRCHD